MALTSSAWTDGGTIPDKHTQAGEDVSPPLSWSNVPAGTVSFVLMVHDPDSAIGSGTDDTLHWMLWNLPATVTSLHERAPSMAQLPDGTRQILRDRSLLSGPRRPAAGPAHHYLFELYALDITLDDARGRRLAGPDSRRRRRGDGRTRPGQGGLCRPLQAAGLGEGHGDRIAPADLQPRPGGGPGVSDRYARAQELSMPAMAG